MPVYNAEKYIKAAISSILNQTFQNFELIIINDGSTDNSAELIRSFSDPRIRYIEQANKGLPQTLNEGLILAKGQYIARMDQDDIAYPGRLEKQINFLNNHPEYILVSTNVQTINESGMLLNSQLFPIQPYIPPLEWLLLWETPIAHPTVMLRAEALKKSNLKYKDVQAEDSDLWRELAFYGRFHRLDEVLLSYRVHSQSLSQRKNIETMQAAIAQAQAYSVRLGLKDFESFTIFTGYREILKDHPLPAYPEFSKFVTESIKICAAKWSFNQAEKNLCLKYSRFLYFSTAIYLKGFRGALLCLQFPWNFLIFKRCYNFLFSRIKRILK